jgi:DNA mismatch repair ATPase MutS
MVQDSSDTQSDSIDEDVTFLYRLCDGSSPRSYGINVARIAKLPLEVLQLAQKQSKYFENALHLSKAQNNRNHIQCDTSLISSDIENRDSLILLMMQFFDHLVSVMTSDISSSELLWLTTELWNRYTHLKRTL